MHLRKSDFLLFTTAALTSIALASRPSSATPWVRLDADVDIAQRDVNHKLVDEPDYSVVKGNIWADESQIQEGAAFLKNAQHDPVDVDAKIKNDVAKRAEVSATTTEHSTKTLTTDAANPTGTLREKLTSNQQVKAKFNANSQAQHDAESLASASSAPAAKQSSSPQTHSGTATKKTKTHATINADTAVKTRVKISASELSVENTEKPTFEVNTRSRNPQADKTGLASLQQSPSTVTTSPPPPQSLLPSSQQSPHSDTIAKASAPDSSAADSTQPTNIPINPDSNNVKRAPSGFDYIYDSTTLLVTPPHTTGHYASASTMKLRFGVVSLSPTTKKSNSHV